MPRPSELMRALPVIKPPRVCAPPNKASAVSESAPVVKRSPGVYRRLMESHDRIHTRRLS